MIFSSSSSRGAFYSGIGVIEISLNAVQTSSDQYFDFVLNNLDNPDIFKRVKTRLR